jgi:hypothetical protein
VVAHLRRPPPFVCSTCPCGMPSSSSHEILCWWTDRALEFWPPQINTCCRCLTGYPLRCLLAASPLSLCGEWRERGVAASDDGRDAGGGGDDNETRRAAGRGRASGAGTVLAGPHLSFPERPFSAGAARDAKSPSAAILWTV